jgi:serine/threonine protein kinase
MSAGLIAGRYRIERVLGQGATATVHFARDTERGTAVAIKLLRQELAKSSATERFLKEIRRTSQLQHPHILQVLDSGEHEGRPFFVLPYMEGGTLRRRLGKSNQLPFEETIGILRTVASALDYAHQKGLVHRDIKPENILFTNGQACVGDFGIARVLETVYGTDGTTSSDTIRGTWAYMSPEQAAGSREIDGRSDIYSLACVAYEMITGMQAFIGPTPEAVVAQRFAYTPRDVRAYRPSAPPAVDTALARAFAMAPADRYRSVTEFIDALDAAVSDNGPPIVVPEIITSEWSAGHGQGRVLLMSVAGIAVVSALWLAFVPSPPMPTDAAVIDTTRIVVLPLERDSSALPAWRDDDLLQQALARYRDISLVDQFQVSDALKRRTIRTSEDAVAIASSVGAGRFIRGSVRRLGEAWIVNASLYDRTKGRSLYQADELLPNDLRGASIAYARLADSLLLRGASADAVPIGSTGTRSLAAVQAFSRAQSALDEWDLAGADSGFLAATVFDPEHARASLWLAQVRAWQGLPENSWGTVAERANAIVGQLGDRERKLARALVSLAARDFRSACATYEELRRQNARDFAAWFGLGQCNRSNRRVVADPRSPSGWSFEASARQWIAAYTRAFEILPSVHRGYERGAFARLRVLMLVGSELHRGIGPDSAMFYARPAWINDTLALIPYPWQRVFSDAGDVYPPGHEKARMALQSEFARIASSWSAAFPNSVGAKESVAISLEIASDVAAIDTLRAARRLTRDAVKATQLAVYEVLLLAKFGIAGQASLLVRANSLADSLIDSSTGTSAPEATAIAYVAALTGRCNAAASFTARGTLPGEAGISSGLITRGFTLLPHLAAGCYRTASSGAVRELFSAIDAATSNSRAQERRRIAMILLYRPIMLSPDPDRTVLDSLAAWSTDSLLVAAAAIQRGDTANARSALAAVNPVNSRRTLTPDIALARAFVALRTGDTATAIRVLDKTLADARSYDVNTLADLATGATLVHSAVLRAELALSRGDTATGRRWSVASRALWADADPEPRRRVTNLVQALRLPH